MASGVVAMGSRRWRVVAMGSRSAVVWHGHRRRGHGLLAVWRVQGSVG